MASIQVSLSDADREFIEHIVSEGDFASVDEVVAAAIDRLRSDDSAYWAEVRAMITEAGDPSYEECVPATPELFERIKREGRERLARRRQAG
jgi:putative addiction module CopG family antidote